jgi:hypothetical protein
MTKRIFEHQSALHKRAFPLTEVIFPMTQRVCKNILSFLCLVLASLLLNPHMTYSQNTATPKSDLLMDRMIGEWVMTGTIANQQVTHDVYVDWILKRQYVRIHEVSREKELDGNLAYEAWIHIAWDKENAEYVVMWLDNTATTNFAAEGVGHGKSDLDRIPFVWKSADGSGLHNTFAYDQVTDTWSWEIDNVDKSGKISPFARLTLKRKLKQKKPHSRPITTKKVRTNKAIN